jgi:hypothetical protein
MLTSMSITSLDQGSELARRQVAKLYAEPSEPAPETLTTEADVSETATAAVASRPKWRALFTEFITLWDAGYSVGTRRY